MFLFFKSVDSVLSDIIDNMDTLQKLADRHHVREEYHAQLAILNRNLATRASKIVNKLQNILGE